MMEACPPPGPNFLGQGALSGPPPRGFRPRLGFCKIRITPLGHPEGRVVISPFPGGAWACHQQPETPQPSILSRLLFSKLFSIFCRGGPMCPPVFVAHTQGRPYAN